MTQADSVHSTPPLSTSSRRNFLVHAAAVAAGGAALAVALPTEVSADNADIQLLTLEEQIFEAHDAAVAYNDEITRCMMAWRDELLRLEAEAAAGRCRLTRDEQWHSIKGMPEALEQKRLCGLQEPHLDRVDKLVKEMWSIPAQTPQGRRAKVEVLLVCVMGVDWRDNDDDADYDIRMARKLLIEFVGGQPAETLADQFAGDVKSCA